MDKRLRKKRGIYTKFKDNELWDLDLTIAQFVLPRLIQFKKTTKGYPGRLIVDDNIDLSSISDSEDDKYVTLWNNILDKMIWSFEQIVTNSEEPQLPDEAVQRVDMKDGIWNYEIDEQVKQKFWDDTQAYNNRIQEGLRLFAEYFRDLWW